MDRPQRATRRRRWLIGLAVAAALLLCAAATVPVVVGMQSQSRLDTITTRASERVARLEWSIESFEQGAYSSRASTRMTWRFPEAERPPADLELRHRIHHGPRPNGLYWARVETVPVLDNGAGARLAAIYDERAPFAATYTEGVTGTQRLDVRSPAVAANAGPSGRAVVTSQGFDLRVERSKSEQTVTIDGELPGFELRADSGRIRLHDLTVTGELDQSQALTTGQLRLALAGVDLRRRHNADREPDDFLALRRLRISEHLDEAEGALAGRVSVEADDLAVARERYRDLRAEVAAEGIPATLIERLNRAAREANAQGKAPRAAMLSALQVFSPAEAVAHGPSIRLERIAAKTPSGPVRVDGRVGVDGDARVQGWLDVLLTLDARLRIDVPTRLARALAARYFARQADASGSSPSDEALAARAAEQLAALERKGWINRQQGQVDSELTFEAGALRINDQRVIDLGRMFGR